MNRAVYSVENKYCNKKLIKSDFLNYFHSLTYGGLFETLYVLKYCIKIKLVKFNQAHSELGHHYCNLTKRNKFLQTNSIYQRPLVSCLRSASPPPATALSNVLMMSPGPSVVVQGMFPARAPSC